MDTGVGFRGATLNLKDCRYPTGLFERVVWLKYPVLYISVIPGVRVHLSWVMGKSPLTGLLTCLLLFWFVPCFYLIFVSLLYCWPYLSLFPTPKKGRMWFFDVWCPLPFVGDVSVPLLGFGSKNLIGLVQSGKPLGLFSVMWPYARVWHFKHLMGRQAPLNLSLAWVVARASALDSLT